ncbi:lipoate--protein ligase family protein [bacterium]|nr:lipoate--protein ligase family protein [bacterium]MDA7657107.1 lipoate--protein ligase family protein [Verrucomicrobiota bacterium]
MNRINVQFDDPFEHLVCDDLLLNQCDQNPGVGSIRFWETDLNCVVLGYGNDLESEVFSERCRSEKVSVVRRCSGGGAVVLGHGCLNYSLILPIKCHERLASVNGANELIMDRNRSALQGVSGDVISVRGYTDLVSGDIKFSGNAQRRRRQALLFHGTFLLDFDVSLMERLLRFPSRQPDYRKGRSHSVFVGNLSATRSDVVAAMMKEWCVETEIGGIDRDIVLEAVSTRRKSLRWQLIR